ncbi:MAG TPA: hypothetical protein ENI60_07980 [Candidatus Fraserbacteria bacterium]|nr:hypothetical protein [Candidatus Fraserbacteria bacterium]
MKRSLLITTLMVLALVASAGQALAQQTPSLPYNYYDLEVRLNPTRQALVGQETIVYFNDSASPLPAIYFNLAPNYLKSPDPYLSPLLLDESYPDGFDPGWLKVKSVQDEQGAKLSYRLLPGPPTFQNFSLADTLMRVELPRPLPPGARQTLIIGFATRFPNSTSGDEAYYRDTYTWRSGWQPVAVPAKYLTQGKYPSNAQTPPKEIQPSALYELTLTIPAGYQAAIGADHQEIISRDEQQHTETIHALSATPTRSVPLSIGKDYQHYSLAHSDIPIEVYYLPGDQAAARLIASYAAESLDYYRQRWGKYPHHRLLIVSSASVSAGFSGAAADELIILNRSLFADKDLAVRGLMDRWLDQIIAHEIAHQWWGIGIGADLNAQNFLSESFAQYFSITYFEHKYGSKGGNVFQPKRDGLLERYVKSQFGYINLRQHLEGDLPYITAFDNHFDEAIIKPQQRTRYLNQTAERLYNKGYLVLRALRGLLGQAQMDRLLKTAQQKYLHRVMTVEELRTLAEQLSGQDLTLFFEDWLYRNQDSQRGRAGQAPYIDLGVAQVRSSLQPDGQYQNEIVLTRRGSARLPAQLVATSASGHIYRVTWQVAQQAERRYTLLLTSDSPLTEVQLDPNSWLPDVNRLNNTWLQDEPFGRKLDVILDGDNAMPLDAYLIRFDPTRQLLEGGFLREHRWWIGNGFAGFLLNLHRGSSLSASLDLIGQLAGKLQWTKSFYSWPVTGYPGRYWQASDLLKLSLVRSSDASGHPGLDRILGAAHRMITYLDLRWRHKESLSGLYSYWLALQDDPFSFQRLQLGGSFSLRVAPQAALTLSLAGGWGQNLSGLFHFNLSELRGFQKAVGYPFPGNVKFFGQLSLHYPMQRDMNYDLLGLVALGRVDERLYLQGANTWQRLDDIRLDQLKVELGFELTAVGRTFGGLFPFDVTVGFVYPLSGINESARQVKQYFRISTPLL